ncbi:unnamed protein product [Cunninghamella echinulata]
MNISGKVQYNNTIQGNINTHDNVRRSINSTYFAANLMQKTMELSIALSKYPSPSHDTINKYLNSLSKEPKSPYYHFCMSKRTRVE